MKSKSELRVAIIGGGIGGAATAVALQREGIRADIYEQAPVIKEVGAGVGLRPPTVHFFKNWGIYEEIEKKSSKSDFMQVVACNGDVLVSERWPLLTDNPEGKWARLIHRADLIETFLNQLPSDSIHLSHRLESITDQGDHAEILFENGHSIEADLVIGADGIRSTIRSKLFSDTKPIYSGTHAYRAIVNDKEAFELVLDHTFKVFVDGGIQIYILPLHHRNQVSFDVTLQSKDPSWRPIVEKKDIVKHLKNFDTKIQKIAENVEEYTCRSIYDIDSIERWHSNCVTLLGDAAHAMLHHTGQGIQDAGVLAEALREADSIPEALQTFQARRKPVTDKYQELSRQEPSIESETAFPEKGHFEKA
ncbi:FAD-dependent oxidoreductase [Halalkalibacter alkalisediminis]|uniref:FAD-dependent oxidoreductase n=1 Tax=Halalkalibacter alkalisediminis TaxID=935616 RepID=A0ABV6NKB5_9BACI|nr:FAD-dependent monooxygenase [Halalkalibacter alkalisediminis]